MRAVVVIGAGHNGLAAAFYLARAGLKPIVFERRATVGGGAMTGELHRGFHCPTLSHHAALWSDVFRDMDLAAHGAELLMPAVEVFAPSHDGRAIALTRDGRLSAASTAALDARDATAYATYRESLTRVAGVVASLLASAPPDLDNPAASDLWSLLGVGRQFRALGRTDAYRLLRWVPMPIADLVQEWFESDLLRAVVAAPGVSGTMFGPRSAGSSLVLLLREAHRLLCHGMSRVKGGPGALTAAMAAAAAAAGARIRTATPVDRVVTKDGRVTGVVAGTEEVPADAVVSAIDPRTTFLKLVDPIDLEPGFRSKIEHYRSTGTLAKVNLALSGLPSFSVGQQPAPPELLSGRIHIGASLDDLERAFDCAKYGELPGRPWLEVTIPSILDAGLAPQGSHVMSIYAHYVPYHLRSRWPASKDLLFQSVMQLLEEYSPGIGARVVASQVVTPEEMESEFAFAGGHPFHGEIALDQLFAMRPVLGFGRYTGPLDGLYLCSAGTHPGGFMAGASGRLAARRIIADLT